MMPMRLLCKGEEFSEDCEDLLSFNGSAREDDIRDRNRNRPRKSVEVKEFEKEQPTPMDEDAYGSSIACLIRDTERFISGTEYFHVRAFRLVLSVAIVLLVIALQVFLLCETR